MLLGLLECWQQNILGIDLVPPEYRANIAMRARCHGRSGSVAFAQLLNSGRRENKNVVGAAELGLHGDCVSTGSAMQIMEPGWSKFETGMPLACLPSPINAGRPRRIGSVPDSKIVSYSNEHMYVTLNIHKSPLSNHARHALLLFKNRNEPAVGAGLARSCQNG